MNSVSRSMSKFDAYFSDIFRIMAKKPGGGGGGGGGGLTPNGKITKPGHFLL